MDLYLIRHAIAEPRRAGLAEEDRALTEEGRRRFARVVAGLRGLGVRFDRLLTSPMLRAQQTAEMAGELCEGEPELEPALARPAGPELLAALEGEAVALVGHEPWMSELLVWLTQGNAGRGGGVVMKKGGVAWLRGAPSPGGMVLVALVPPRVFRGLLGGGPRSA